MARFAFGYLHACVARGVRVYKCVELLLPRASGLADIPGTPLIRDTTLTSVVG
jgi:hypothetical protein|eukprot:COSAG02_NODE_16857_length_1050_cov_2.824395_1_plen_53_part_00